MKPLQSSFLDKITQISPDLNVSCNTGQAEEMPNTLSGLLINIVTIMDINRILESVKATTYALDPCQSWVLKSCKEHINEPMMMIINQPQTQGTFLVK